MNERGKNRRQSDVSLVWLPRKEAASSRSTAGIGRRMGSPPWVVLARGGEPIQRSSEGGEPTAESHAESGLPAGSQGTA